MKKVTLFLLLAVTNICFATVCPSSLGQAQAGGWQAKFVDRHANFNHFGGAVWRPGNKVFCAYPDLKKPSTYAVFGKGGVAKPAYGGKSVWRKDPNGIVCTKSIYSCKF